METERLATQDDLILNMIYSLGMKIKQPVITATKAAINTAAADKSLILLIGLFFSTEMKSIIF